MQKSPGTERLRSIDWLPWGLSVFGACCAVFVLVKGVLPERSVNQRLSQKVMRLETDLAQMSQTASTSLEQAKDKLARQNLLVQAQVTAAREQERLRAAHETARRELGQSLASEIEHGDAVVEERSGELVVMARERLLFTRDGALKPTGRKFLRELAASIKRLPADQVYRVGGVTERRQQSVTRFLELALRVPKDQLATRDLPGSEAQSDLEIVLVRRKR